MAILIGRDVVCARSFEFLISVLAPLVIFGDQNTRFFEELNWLQYRF